MLQLAVRRSLLIGVLIVSLAGSIAMAAQGDAVLSILVRDPVHPCAPYQSTTHNFWVQIFHCDGKPLIWNGLNYGVFPGVLMTVPGPMGGRIQIDVRVPSGSYIVRALAPCKNVVTDWVYVEACCGNIVCVNLVLPTVKYCIERMIDALYFGTLDPEGQEGRVIDAWPREVRDATASLKRIADLLPEDAPQFPSVPTPEEMSRFFGTGPDGACCGTTGGVTLDLTAVPHPLGAVTSKFVWGGVTFDPSIGMIQFLGPGRGLFSYGSVGAASAAVRLSLDGLPCRACSVSVVVDGHGQRATLTATFLDKTVQTQVCDSHERCTLTITASAENPITLLELSGQEAEWFEVKVN